MKKYNAYNLINELEFERTSGSAEEHKAADIIVKHLEELEIPYALEEFMVDVPIIKNVKFMVLEPYEKNYDATMYMLGANTNGDLICDFLYVDNADMVSLKDAKDKIVLVNERITYDGYKNLIDSKVAGFICYSGTLYDNLEDTDLEERMLRPRHYDLGKLPGVAIRVCDAQEIVLNNASKVLINCLEEEVKAPSKNVIAFIEGTTYKDEEIVFTAHYDSVRFSKGSYDNATGSATILQLLHYFKENQPKRTLKFIWCASEERGLLGSKAYVELHKEELEKIKFCLNVDMTSVILGYDICVCTSNMSLVNVIDALGKEVGFPIKVTQGVYSSDSTPFANENIPSVSFARLTTKGGAQIHSRVDDMRHLSIDSFYKTYDFIELFAKKIVNAQTVFVERKMPDEMIKKLDEYLKGK